MKLEVTEHQLKCIINAADTMSAMVGVGEKETDEDFKKTIKGIDRMLKKNGFKRHYN